MSNYKKLGKNVLLLTIGSFSSKLLSFFFVPFYTYVLSTAEYGIADLITTTVSLLFPFFTCIISEAAMRFAQEKENDEEMIFEIGMLIWVAGLVILLILSPVFCLVSTIKPYWGLILLYYVGYSLYTNFGYFLRGIEKVSVFAIAGILNTVISIGCNLLFLLIFKMGIKGYLYSFIISNISVSSFMVFSAKIYRYSLKRVDISLLKKMLHYSLPLIPNSASWWISNSSDRYILIMYAGIAVNGIYSISYKIPTIITMVTSIFVTAWRISAVDSFGTEESRKFYSDVFDMYITITVITASILMLINKPLSGLLYSKEFYVAWRFVPILLIASALHSYSDFFGTIYTSAMKTKMLFYSTLVGAISNICLNFLLIPKFSAMGAAIATMISYGIVWMVRVLHSRTILKLEYRTKSDIGCAVLLFLQVVIAINDYSFEYIASGLIVVFLILIRKKSILGIIQMIIFRGKKSKMSNDADRVSVTKEEVDSLAHEFSNLKAYAGRYIDNETLLQCSSGGAANALAEAFIDNGGVVIGSRYSTDFKSAYYTAVDNKDDLFLLRGSKYIPSSKTNEKNESIYENVESLLSQNKKVLFIGLGCDVASIIKFCENKKLDTHNLYTIDLICHGPTLPEVQQSFVEEFERKYKSKIMTFSIKHKARGWAKPCVYIKFENGKEIVYPWEETDFCYAFGHYSRSGCSKCLFKGNGHRSSMTIGDYWGVDPNSEIYDKNGVSVLIINNAQGQSLLSIINRKSFLLDEVNIGHVVANNPMFYRCRAKDEDHEKFSMYLKNRSLHCAVIKHMGFVKYIYSKLVRML